MDSKSVLQTSSDDIPLSRFLFDFAPAVLCSFCLEATASRCAGGLGFCGSPLPYNRQNHGPRKNIDGRTANHTSWSSRNKHTLATPKPDHGTMHRRGASATIRCRETAPRLVSLRVEGPVSPGAGLSRP